MKLRNTALITLTVISIVLAGGYVNRATSHTSNAPAGYCGSIVNSATCTSCHSGGTNAIRSGWITSTIPGTGYVPGTTYTITAIATATGRSKFGFEISPQNTAGTKLGTMIVTSSTRTQLLSAGRYITHKSAGTAGANDSITWAFDWTAPAVGSGNVTFYGAFLCSNSNNSSSGDQTFKANLPVTEDLTTGIEGTLNTGPAFSVYPNPATDHIVANYEVAHQGRVEIKLYDVHGRVEAVLLSGLKASGHYRDLLEIPFNLGPGVYFLEIVTETGNTVTKMLVQQ